MAYSDNSNNSSNNGQGKTLFKGFSSKAEQSNYKLYDFALIKQNLINRLSIRKGERVENPEFGTIIYDMLFEPLTNATKELIANDISENLNADPRVSTSEIVVSENGQGISVQATLTYIPYNITEKLSFNFDQNSTFNLS